MTTRFLTPWHSHVQHYNCKWSGFYGPDGLMGVLVMHKHFSKVHGSEDTVMSIVY